MIILDTCILIDFDKFGFNSDEGFAASILSRAELDFGVQMSKDPVKRAQRVQDLVQLDGSFDWLPFDFGSSIAYGIIASQSGGGSRVRGKDALIAAQAYQHGATLMTANLADFKPFAHLIPVIPPPN